MVYRYKEHYYSGDSDCWVAVLGSGEFTRHDLEKMLTTETGEQRGEVEKALAAMPDDGAVPTRDQKRLEPVDDAPGAAILNDILNAADEPQSDERTYGP